VWWDRKCVHKLTMRRTKKYTSPPLLFVSVLEFVFSGHRVALYLQLAVSYPFVSFKRLKINLWCGSILCNFCVEREIPQFSIDYQASDFINIFSLKSFWHS
jgi:hypothetical protein